MVFRTLQMTVQYDTMTKWNGAYLRSSSEPSLRVAMMIPDDRMYSEDHIWVKLDEAQVLLGVTDVLLKNLGTIVSVELPEPGDEMMPDIPFGEIESMEKIYQMYPPGDGEVLERNEMLGWKPERLAEDPYGEGWLLKIKIEDTEQLKQLMNAESYEEKSEDLSL